ncbi:MAG: RNA pyrophosphohydrolase [bacterium]|nr:MAG: RNA pyrophosphohydrolase [bacterium]
MKLPPQYFRAGVGVIVINREGHVLAMERVDVPGAWQLPQGGLDEDEEPKKAAFREVMEETAISEDSLELIDAYPEPLAYELPAANRKKKTGRGQVHYWFLFQFTGDESTIDVTSGGEFSTWRWMPFGALLETVVEFRKPVYERLAEYFATYLSR